MDDISDVILTNVNPDKKIKKELTEEQKERRKQLQREYYERQKNLRILKNDNDENSKIAKERYDNLKIKNKLKFKEYYENKKEIIQNKLRDRYHQKMKDTGKNTDRYKEVFRTNEEKFNKVIALLEEIKMNNDDIDNLKKKFDSLK
ncbi:hypothetical protein BMW23_0279 [Bodo saltans virus]|uniref:Uncharacterized protein n=1 Tax=Bodo saltans virus TaxID=2024608 RepID=A0A2H4UU11_9VIRU|nr:hypothetical protein QJ851_gp0274 [Bodo saltans virus]ATZ80337.1 hypothetical protein BMW23_0279 [Bodo saltans virus]